MYLLYFVIIFHLVIGMTEIRISFIQKDALRKFGWNWPTSSGEEDFLILVLSMLFCYFIIISICKSTWPFIWTNTHGDFCQVRLKLDSSGSGEKFELD